MRPLKSTVPLNKHYYLLSEANSRIAGLGELIVKQPKILIAFIKKKQECEIILARR